MGVSFSLLHCAERIWHQEGVAGVSWGTMQPVENRNKKPAAGDDRSFALEELSKNVSKISSGR
ncbi:MULTISPECIES: hypothetical protein [unclassified Rhizobium]|uniref:hypothetical protein n=1 Tax=unclassified Rhizobium TaxID=2613769 RepID=UPI0012E2F7AE|nr:MULTISPECIES: hypothetical protein [unclassified Rhizobium]